MRLPICWTVMLVALAASVPAFALSPEWDQCADVNNVDTADKSLAACNRILNDRGEAKNHAMAFRNRCAIRYTKSDYDPALADCNTAARMEPQSAIVYNRRGLIWFAKGDDERAIADFDQAIRIKPDFAHAYFNRGLAWRKKGDNARADADKAKALRLDPKVGD